MAGDICIIKVYFKLCDKPILNPIRIIIDEHSARNGNSMAIVLKWLNAIINTFNPPMIYIQLTWENTNRCMLYIWLWFGDSHRRSNIRFTSGASENYITGKMSERDGTMECTWIWLWHVLCSRWKSRCWCMPGMNLYFFFLLKYICVCAMNRINQCLRCLLHL